MILTFRLDSQVPRSLHFRSDHHPLSPPPPLNPRSFYHPSGRNRRKSGRSVIAADVSQNLLAIWAREFHLTLSCLDRGLPCPTGDLNEGSAFYPPALGRSSSSPSSHHCRRNLPCQNKKQCLPPHLHPPC